MAERHIHFHFGTDTVSLPAKNKPKLPLYVAINQKGLSPLESIKTSSNGINWNNIKSGGFDSGNAHGLAYYSSLWVAVGQSTSPLSTIQYSRNGSNWSNANSPGFNIGASPVANANGVVHGSTINGSSIWVAVGDDIIVKSTIKYSYNGINWSNIITGGFGYNYGQGVAYGNGIWVAVGNGTTRLNSIQYSGDGVNWSNSRNIGFDAGSGGLSVAYGNSLWVAVGNCANINAPVSTILYSKDGSNWSNAVSGGFYYYGKSVAYGSNMWVAVGNGGNSQQTLQYSGDGSNWSNANGVYNSPTAVTYTQTATLGKTTITYKNLWIAFADARVQYSVDGSNWTYKPNDNVAGVVKA